MTTATDEGSRPAARGRFDSRIASTRPTSTLLALEPRLMFDGAAAATADPATTADRATPAPDRTAARDAGGTPSGALDAKTLDAKTFDVDNGSQPTGAMGQAPVVSLSIPSTDVLLGEVFRFTVGFDNAGDAAGYGPYVDLFVPSNGHDGGSAPDGVTIDGASHLGRALDVVQVVLSADDIASGTVSHPYARDASGSSRIDIPAGFVAGDRLVVIGLPYSGFSADQPVATIAVDARLSALADAECALQIVAQGGFRYGYDASSDPTDDPTRVGDAATLSIDPSTYRLTTTYIGPEGETATGPNYTRAFRIDVDIAEGHTFDAIDLTAALDQGMRFTALQGTPTAIGGVSIGDLPSGGWTNVDGVLVSAAATSNGDPSEPGGSVRRTFDSVTGTASATDLSMVVGFHVPESGADCAPVLDAISGDSRTLSLDVVLAASATPFDTRDGAMLVCEHVNDAAQVEARSIALRSSYEIAIDKRGPGLGPGDVLQYTLDIDVSDYFAFGGSTYVRPLSIVDTLSDGQLFLDGSDWGAANPVLTIVRDGGQPESYQLIRGENYNVVTRPDGRQQITFDLGSTICDDPGQQLVGDLFACDASQDGATTAQLTFNAKILDAYRVGPPDAAGNTLQGATQLALNEGDRIVNDARIGGTVLNESLSPWDCDMQADDDGSTIGDRIATSTVSVAVAGINGGTVPGGSSGPVCVGPGDTVSYVVEYVVTTGDFEGLRLSAFVPGPMFDVNDVDADGTPSGLVQAQGPFDATPEVGTWTFEVVGQGADDCVDAPRASTLSSANGLVFDFGNRTDASDLPLTLRVSFTLAAGDTVLPDARPLAVVAQADSRTTAGEPITSQSIDVVCSARSAVQKLTGTLWDDTIVPDSSIGVPEARLQGVTVTLTQAGADGQLDTADDAVRTTLTGADGRYTFEGVSAGNVRITAPTTIANANGTLGEVRARTDVQGNPTDATIALTVDAGRSYDGLDIGYVQRNDAPTVAVPPAQTVAEDASVPIRGISVGDVDAGPNAVLDVALTVGSGRIDVAATPGVVVTGNGTNVVALSGTIADLNAALATVVYGGNADYSGNDTLVVRVGDRGNTGDVDDDRLPTEQVDDALFAIATVPISVMPRPDAPIARPDVRTTTERVPIVDGEAVAGNPRGDVADTDPDGPAPTVQGVTAGTPGGAVTGGVGVPIVTPLGTLTVQPDGRYTYVPGTSLPGGTTARDVFTYTVTDGTSTSTTTITIVITGVNDAPASSSVSQTIDRPAPGAPPVAVLPPEITDVDNPSSSLTVRVDDIGRPQSGTFLRPDGRPVAPGDTLTVDEVQRLTYRPAPDQPAPSTGDGSLPGSSLVFTVRDPDGATGTGRIDLVLRPPAAVVPGPSDGTAGGGSLPGAAPPNVGSSVTIDSPPGGSPGTPGGPTIVGGVTLTDGGPVPVGNGTFPPWVFGPLAPPLSLTDGPGSPVASTVGAIRDGLLADRSRLDPDGTATDLDAGGLFPSTRVDGLYGPEIIGPLAAVGTPGAAGGSLPGTAGQAPSSGLPGGPSGTTGSSFAMPAAPGVPALPADARDAAERMRLTAKSTTGNEGDGPTAEKAVKAGTGDRVAPDDECVPPPKPKPKAVKRVLPDSLQRPSGSFTEQIQVQKQKFRPPPKVAPTPPSRQC